MVDEYRHFRKDGLKKRGVKFPFVGKSVSDIRRYFLGWCDGPLLREKWVLAGGWQLRPCGSELERRPETVALFGDFVVDHLIKVKKWAKPSLNSWWHFWNTCFSGGNSDLFFRGEFNFPGISQTGSVVGCKQSQRFLEGVRETFLVQVMERPARLL